jgi:hypothetical protein
VSRPMCFRALSACCLGGDLGESMCWSGKWSCNGLDVRRSMRRESMRYQLDPAGAGGSICICAGIECRAEEPGVRACLR